MSEQGTLTGKTDNGLTWTYTGDILNGLCHGKGIWKFANGNVYEGDSVDGKFHGKGKWTSSDGEVYEGNFADNKPYGKGKLTRPNGEVYEGDFNVDLIPHGKGKLIKADGAIYEGDIVDGKRHGKGKLTANGDVYEGEFVDDKPHGKGKVTTANGEVYDADEYFSKNSDNSSDKTFKVEREKKELKTLLILSAVGFVLGVIIGASGGNVLLGMWFGIGIGGALSFISLISSMFKTSVKEQGFGEGVKTAFGGIAIWLIIFILAGPIALLVRVLKKNSLIKKLQGN
jgi:hypothetical protein